MGWIKRLSSEFPASSLVWVEFERLLSAECLEFLSSSIIPQLNQAISRPGLLRLHRSCIVNYFSSMQSNTYLEIWTFVTHSFDTTESIQSTTHCHETGMWTGTPRISGAWEGTVSISSKWLSMWLALENFLYVLPSSVTKNITFRSQRFSFCVCNICPRKIHTGNHKTHFILHLEIVPTTLWKSDEEVSQAACWAEWRASFLPDVHSFRVLPGDCSASQKPFPLCQREILASRAQSFLNQSNLLKE